MVYTCLQQVLVRGSILLKVRDVFSHNLKELMHERRLSSKALAEGIGTDPSTITHWVKGREVPSANNLDKLATYLNVPVGAFFMEPQNSPLFKPTPTADPAMNDVMKYLAKAVAEEMKKDKDK